MCFLSLTLGVLFADLAFFIFDLRFIELDVM
ncbi:hypothetical protein TRL7639_04420 [Falsiruegeria litorea R37]|uniref:Uncharacterized protein n=1 Tax=Falsiruegeria litorea R37 TaxID=1200284 RepID=A0A1Y5TYC9_9RHOB|nr:hypothetical protein TRL7639_04420 [Falsiruegeria litorea R37]